MNVRGALAVVLVLVPSAASCGGAAPGVTPPASGPSPVATSAGGGGATADPPPSGPPVQVDCGDFTTCAIAAGGEVRCWGRDKAGELGDGGGSDRPKGVVVRGVEHATAIALASQFACALGADKRVKCWGTGRIANDGKPRERAKALDVAGVEGVVELVASGAIACARTESTITCWGADSATIGTPPSGAFAQVAAGFTHGCALDKKGAVTCWGTGEWAGPRGGFARPASISGATFLATGDRHACVVTRDKKVQCWGMNDAGQLGTRPDTELHRNPVTVPGVTSAVKLVAGEAAMCALLADGSARCWGDNADGELGLGKKSSEERATKVVSVPDIAGMCLATAHGCALTKSKSIMCWGSNTAGQLGDGTKEKKLEPARVAW
jgi:alpha-tubulin suppressor-like RCC1 family protein